MINKFIKTYFVILLVLLSGTVYFGLLYRQNMVILLAVSCILCIIIMHYDITKNNMLIFIMISIIFILNVIANIKYIDYTLFKNYFAYIIIAFTLAVIASNINKEEFRKNYILTMFIIGAISIVCYLISQKMPSLASRFYHIVTTKNGNVFIASPFYTWGWNYIFPRNAGMFWEPGAFQGYLNLAILFLNEEENNIRKYILILFFSILVITSGSTTGYIILPFILLAVFLKNYKKIKKYRFIIAMFFMILVIAVAGYILKSNNINNKFNSSNESYSKRSKDVTQTYKVMFERPFTGYGLNTEEGNKQVMVYNDVGGNSSGILVIGYSFGIPVLLIYFIRLFFGLKNTFRNINILLLIGIFLILFMTESINLFPVYMIFLFQWKPVQEPLPYGTSTLEKPI